MLKIAICDDKPREIETAKQNLQIYLTSHPELRADVYVFFSAVELLCEREIFLGTNQDMFGPNESMTRAMFVTVIGRLCERSYGSVSGINAFSDVNSDDYYAKYVARANENGIIKGIGENKDFREKSSNVMFSTLEIIIQ